MKRLLSVLLVVVITLSIWFQCSITSSAIAGVDDVVVLGVCLDLLALGISIHSVEQFCQSQHFADFCRDIGNHIDSGISTMRRNGRLFVATTKLAWQDLCNWVKSKFHAGDQNKSITFDSTVETNPDTITLNNGNTVPWADWMDNPFFVYTVPATGNTWGIITTGENPGVNIGTRLYRVWCTGRGKIRFYKLVNGAWDTPIEYDMHYGSTYKGVAGSFYDIQLASSAGNTTANATQFRTMELVNDSGDAIESSPPNNVPDEYEPTPAVVVASSDPIYFPGAVDAPAEVIEDNDLILIPVPDNLITESVPGTPDLTTSLPDIAHTVAETAPADVKTYVYNNYNTTIVNSPSDVIADTPAIEIPGGNVETDIETANKFRLPKSFLEGFPFSIPYSIYVGIQSFVAEPQAPVFNFPFTIPALGLNQDIVIDLNQWNAVARLCRALLSVVWVAGLAMVCSRFIKR